jgi:glucosamine--fructose-6-phosphate aminotransferase (isomerizing)
MCGIVGYVGHRQAVELLVEGLHRLEYRGYDSAGIAIQHDGEIVVRKKAGRVAEMARQVEVSVPQGTVGIGHTRWATHGEANDKNSHPHIGGDGSVCLVHNGVIENYEILRGRLQELGFVFHTATDSEVVAHLIAHHFDEQVKLGGDPAEITTCVRAVEVSLKKLKGTYGLGILFRGCPGLLIAVRVGSPLVVGVGKGEYFIAAMPVLWWDTPTKWSIYPKTKRPCSLPAEWKSITATPVASIRQFARSIRYRPT